jgi:uncharacterized protein YqjF (DUF2071 family)
MKAVIDRRILVNYRVDPRAIETVLPHPFRPRLIDGYAIGGICLIRLTDIRPNGLPRWIGVSSENAAHRIAVEWTGPDGAGHGVYVPRRDTTSRLSTLVGGRLFPGEHHRATFDIDEQNGHYGVSFRSVDGTAAVSIDAIEATEPTIGSVFATVDAASDFFRQDKVGYSHTSREGRFDVIELDAHAWNLAPLAVSAARSSFFEDAEQFPAGSVEFDSAFLMRQIDADWRAQPDLIGAAFSS